MNSPLYYRYYDKIFAAKDYRGEVQTVLDLYRQVRGGAPARVLDVGCGTGNHALVLAALGYEVVGLDIDGPAVEVARRKAAQHPQGARAAFFCQDVNDLDAGCFDMAISLFHVVTYIQSLDYLLTFFRAIHRHLTDGGVLVFDAWNGLAALRDPPRDKDVQVMADGQCIDIATRPRIVWMEQRVAVDNHVTVTDDNGNTHSFGFTYEQRLWTPWMLKEALRLAGFTTLHLASWAQPTVPATHETWKILFTCQKAMTP